MQVKQITTAQLTQILLERHTAAKMSVFSNILINTDADLRKKGNPYQNVRKQCQMQVMLNTSYKSGVLNQLKKEGKEPEAYHEGRDHMPLVFGENNKIVGFFKGEPVLVCRPFDKSHPVVTYWSEEGFEVPESEIRDFIKDKGTAENQGTDKQIHWRKIYLKNVLELTIDGTKYEVNNKIKAR